MDFSNYKFRCHYQGSLVSVPKPLTDNQSETLTAYRERINGGGKPLTEKQTTDWHSLETKLAESKVFKLNETAKKLCTEIVFNEKHGRKLTLENKYFDKGLLAEKDSRDLLSDVLGIMLIADESRKENDWVIGKRDIDNKDVIIDLKSTFSFDTFNKHLLESSEEYYFRQLDSYMDLWDIKESLLAFTLVDTPFSLIEDEIKRASYKKSLLTFDGEVKDENIDDVKKIVCQHIFTEKGIQDFCQQSGSIHIEWFDDFKEIPKSERVHLVPHSFDKIRIEQRNECLKLCREFMDTVKPQNNLQWKSTQN
jgi:hypothetical protein